MARLASVITLSSSEDEDSAELQPKKRIKPTPVPVLPNVTITKIPKKKPAVVVLDDETDDEVTCIKDDDTVTNKENGNERENKSNNVLKVAVNDVMEVTDNDVVEVKDNDSCSDSDVVPVVDTINEDSSEGSSSKENEILDSAITKSIVPSCSKSSDSPSNTKLLEEFNKIIDNQINTNEKFSAIKSKFPILWKYYKKCEGELGESNSFKNMLNLSIEKAKKSSTFAVISFNDIFQCLKDNVNAGSIEVDKHQLDKLKKLEKTIKKLVKVISILEGQEVDFDDDENSCYIKVDRYTTRLDKVYKKYCELLEKNPHSGRLIHSKLNFVDSEYNEINRAISKKYKNNEKFPSYYEMHKYIEKIVKENNLDLTEPQIKAESIHCFTKLGELLQNRRRKELYEYHHQHIRDGEDPGQHDADLNETLNKNYLEGELKMQKVIQEFVIKQESKPEESAKSESEIDSDESNYVDSEEDKDEDEDKKSNDENKKSNDENK